MSTEKKVTVRVTRRFEASAERVFNAWLEPERARKFLFATPTGQMVRADIDARVGGSFCFVDRRSGEDVEHVGTYLEIDRPRRLVFTFGVPKYSSDNTRVTVEIVPRGTGCELTLVHEGVLTDYVSQTEAGWGKILGGLEATLSGMDVAAEARA
ncbi:SRPBCC family protein [Hyalangium gracile]|uniref:SRPBCC family protein n=1 Tax=Hyalangium gracile TaxID=394092 RepID=UPI001CCBAD56|nr:SRPBCC domain-containing protein [Hyalangium gracile]